MHDSQFGRGIKIKRGVLNFRRLLVFLVNIIATFLTIFTGLRENPVILFVSGKYDYVRSRLTGGDINYDITRDDLLRREFQLNLTDVGKNYKLIAGPDRSPKTVGEDRNVCMRVNSVNVSVMRTNFDDFWGTGTRRISRYFYSISAPHCEVVNFKPTWIKTCQEKLNPNASACYQYILDNFDALHANRLIQSSTTAEFGILGSPYLRCRGRPNETFDFITDYMLHHSYWAGGSYHVEIQSSNCVAQPVVRGSDWEYGLFKVQPADQASSMLIAVDNTSWVAAIVSYLYGFVSLVLIAQGIAATVMRSSTVLYIPKKLRFRTEHKIVRSMFPFMPAATLLTEDENSVIRFKGTTLMASNLWLNHWLYIALSMMDAVVSIRTTYVVFGKGTWYLAKKASLENFLFTCGALSRLTWFTCLVHTLLRLTLKLMLRGLKTLRLMRANLRRQLEWLVDALALYLSYKVYSVLLCALLFAFLQSTGSVTLMVKGDPYKTPLLGGQASYAGFWQSELVCDYVVIVSLLTAGGWLVGGILLFTKYRYAASNRVVRLLQTRYVFVGWDAFVALDALGIDPYDKRLVVRETAVAACSLGSLLQQMYLSGPSGLVSLGGDYLFEGGGFSREPVVFTFPTKRAIAMGLLETKLAGTGRSTEIATKANRYAAAGSAVASGAMSGATSSHYSSQVVDGKVGIAEEEEPIDSGAGGAPAAFKSLFERTLYLFADGAYGRLLLVDDRDTGKYSANESGIMEYHVRDALSYMGLHDIKHLLGRKKALRIY